MSVEVLKNKRQNAEARESLRLRGLDMTSSRVERILRKLGLLKGMTIGDRLKSWDVLRTIDFINANVPRQEPVLDIGAYSSEVPCILHKNHYTAVSAIDLNPGIREMPYSEAIKYSVANFMETPFDDSSFVAVTATSVIEHGFSSNKLLGELSRILRPGGFFIASVDYWPDKIDTSGKDAFGMEWMIFSREDLAGFIQEAGEFGFSPFGEMNYEAGEPVINWQGESYTFAWFVIQKAV